MRKIGNIAATNEVLNRTMKKMKFPYSIPLRRGYRGGFPIPLWRGQGGGLQLLILLTLFFVACTQDIVINTNESTVHRVNFIETAHSPTADSLYHRFNVMNLRTNNKELIGDIKPDEIDVVSSDTPFTVEGIRRLPSSGGTVPTNIVVSLLVDRSIHTEDMSGIKRAVQYIVDNLPANTAYISFFDDKLGESKRITTESFDLYEDEFTVSTNNKIIFDVAMLKFQELCGSKALNTTDAQFASKISDENIKKVLLILTDGRVDANNFRTADNIQKFSDAVQQLDDDTDNKQHVEIHALRYGERNDDVDFTLSYLCVDIRNADVRGGSYFADAGAFIDNLRVSDNSMPDYELIVSNPEGKIYYGQKYSSGLKIFKNGTVISGKAQFAVGSLLTPLTTGVGNPFLPILFGLLAGLVLLGLAFVIMQLVIPFVRFKMENFDNKYIRNYSFDEDTVIKCHYCQNELRDGEEIVTKCHHTVHKHCWIENGCKCTDYGKYCKHGKQFLYETGSPFSINNRPYYTQWAMYGMAGALASWLVFQLLLFFFPAPLSPLTQWMLSLFEGASANPYASAFYPKLGALFVIGMLLGFTLVLLFSHLNKYRQRKKDSMLIVLLKATAGAVFVFVTFFICAIILIITNAASTMIGIDWLPWLLLGVSIGAVLFFRSNTVLNQILPGVIVSGLLCFLVLLTGSLLGIYAVVIALMIFGAGAGISFISARKIMHKYFLKFTSDKPEKIAIHKWMSVAGGSNEVSIGSSPDAIIQMTWDNHPSIQDIQVKLFYHKKNRLPCIKILSKDVVFNGVYAKNNEEYLLKHGVKFKIGNTEFQYVES